MEKILLQKIASFFQINRRPVIYTFLLILFFVALFLSVTTIDLFIEYSSLPIGLTKALMGIILLKLVDDTVYGRIDTYKEIEKNNVGYAVHMFGIAIIIAAALIGS